MNNYSHIIWDFNGTILADMNVGIDAANILLTRRGMTLIPDIDTYRSAFGFPITDYYRRLGIDFEKECFADVAIEWVEQYRHFYPEAFLQEGVIDALNKFREKKLSQILLSATEINMLKEQISDLKLESEFDRIYGLDNIHAESKKMLAIEMINEVKPHKAVFIGDTTHDFDVACAAGCDCVLVAIGHQHRSALEKCSCPVVGSISDAVGLVLD